MLGIDLSILVSLLVLDSIIPSRAQQEFKNHEVVPDVIDSAPSEILSVSYNGVEVDLGNEFTPAQVKNMPSIHWNPVVGNYYTLMMVDPDAPSRANPKAREWQHWLVGNIPGSDASQGEILTAYAGSTPPKGTGLHRYVLLVYKQPGKLTFDEERLSSTSGKGRGNFSAKKFAAKYKLDLIAGNFFQAQS